MANKITNLTTEQEAQLAQTYQDWLAVGRSCETISREAATKVIGDMYQAIGEERPVVLYFSSPIMCVLAYSVLSNLKGIGKRKVPADNQNTDYSPVFDGDGTAARMYEDGMAPEDITPEAIQQYEAEQEGLEDDENAWMYQ